MHKDNPEGSQSAPVWATVFGRAWRRGGGYAVWLLKQWRSIIYAVVVIAAVVVTGEIAYKQLVVTPIYGFSIGRVRDWKIYANGPSAVGVPGAPVTVTMFGDFECPYCATLAGELEIVAEKDPEEVRLVYRNWPMRSHPHSRIAALGGICAAQLGDFRNYYDLLFSEQGALGMMSVTELARRAGVRDSVSFKACLLSPATKRTLQTDLVAGGRLGVRATPTVLINEYRLEGSVPFSLLDSVIHIADREALH